MDASKGQLLIVATGADWNAGVRRQKPEIRAGDAIWTPPGAKHWHSGSATSSPTHHAIQKAWQVSSSNGSSQRRMRSIKSECRAVMDIAWRREETGRRSRSLAGARRAPAQRQSRNTTVFSQSRRDHARRPRGHREPILGTFKQRRE